MTICCSLPVRGCFGPSPGAVTFWGVADEGGVADVVRGLREGELRRVIFTQAERGGWPLPVYELALLAEAEWPWRVASVMGPR